MFEVKKWSVPAVKCQDWDCLLSLCPATCACNAVTRPQGEIMTFLCSYSFWIFFLSLVCDHRLSEGTAQTFVWMHGY